MCLVFCVFCTTSLSFLLLLRSTSDPSFHSVCFICVFNHKEPALASASIIWHFKRSRCQKKFNKARTVKKCQEMNLYVLLWLHMEFCVEVRWRRKKSDAYCKIWLWIIGTLGLVVQGTKIFQLRTWSPSHFSAQHHSVVEILVVVHVCESL